MLESAPCRTPGAAPAPSRACHGCAQALGGEPGAARLLSEGGKVRAVQLCATCAGAPAAARSAARAAVACTRCGEPAPATARAIAAEGRISVLCRRCSHGGATKTCADEAQRTLAPRPWRGRGRPLGIGVGAAAAAAITIAGFTFSGDDSSAAQPTPSLLDSRLSTARPAGRGAEDFELRVPPRERPQVHDLSYARRGDEKIPLVWYHPIAETRALPSHPGRRFGADRPGDRPAECQEGHCGVDLGHERGRVIHAVRPALVDRIVRTPDRLGGKYIRLYHPEGFFTYYMHLDVIRPTLVPGVEVAAGEPIGLLGSTGIKHSPPHLHFAVAKLLDSGAQHHVDPEPMLRQAVVLDEPAPFPDAWRRPGPRIASARPPGAGEGASAGEGAEILAEGDTATGEPPVEDEAAAGEPPVEEEAAAGAEIEVEAVGVGDALDLDIAPTGAGPVGAIGAGSPLD